MRRSSVRFLMMGIGVLSFAFYACGAYATYHVLRTAWANRPSALTSVLLLAAVTFAFGYADYRFGAGRLLDAIRASPVEPQAAPVFFRRLDALRERMGIARPRVLLSDLGEPNAFAMAGPSGGAVVLDRSLIRLLTVEELDAVLAHELAHLEGHDGIVQLVAFTGLQTAVLVVMLALLPGLLLFTGIAKASAWFRGRPTSWTASFAWQLRTLLVALVLVVPAVFTFVLLARSRRREYAADERAADVTGDPLALARALRKIHDAQAELTLQSVLPDDDRNTDPLARLLATHPAPERRIARLEAMAKRDSC